MELYLCALFADDGRFLTSSVKEAENPTEARLAFEEDHQHTMEEYGVTDTEAFEFPFSLRKLSQARAWVPDGVEEQDSHYDIFGKIDGEEKHILGCYDMMETRTVLSTLQHELDVPCRINYQN